MKKWLKVIVVTMLMVCMFNTVGCVTSFADVKKPDPVGVANVVSKTYAEKYKGCKTFYDASRDVFVFYCNDYSYTLACYKFNVADGKQQLGVGLNESEVASAQLLTKLWDLLGSAEKVFKAGKCDTTVMLVIADEFGYPMIEFSNGKCTVLQNEDMLKVFVGAKY